MMASRKLAHYFHAHTIVVLTEFLLKVLFEKEDFTGRILKWTVELRQYDIKFQPCTAIKTQALDDFVVEFSPGTHPIYPIDLAHETEQKEKASADLTQPTVSMQPNEGEVQVIDNPERVVWNPAGLHIDKLSDHAGKLHADPTCALDLRNSQNPSNC